MYVCVCINTCIRLEDALRMYCCVCGASVSLHGWHVMCGSLGDHVLKRVCINTYIRLEDVMLCVRCEYVSYMCGVSMSLICAV